MSVNLSPIGNGFQFFTNDGEPLTGGKIYTYQAGSSTALATYTTNAGTIANTNPIILGVDGRPTQEIWLTYGYNYKFILTDANDVTVATYDNLYGIVGVQASSVSSFTAGMIMLWSGSIGSIPSGWVLCDGNNSTPNLTDRFIVGAGSSYAVGGTGGSADSIVVAHTHTATSSVTDPGHSHNMGRNVVSFSSAGAVATGTGTGVQTSSATTGITVGTTIDSTGASGTGANIPPYYALAYIMKT
jgi:microcystin-dependent protein